MKLKTEVGQVFLLHPRDENFTTLYEEAFSKHGQPVELFVVLDITGQGGPLPKAKKAEYNQLAQILVSAFKKTYVAVPNLDQGTFEKALSTINTALSRLASKGRVSWYGKLNAAIGAMYENQLSLSTTGNALVHLLRKGELNLLSEGLSETVSRPVKIFSNYSSGKLQNSDRVVFSTNQLVNYISLDQIREFLGEETVGETCQEMIAALQDIKSAGFATFVFEVNSGLAPEPANPVRSVSLALDRKTAASTSFAPQGTGRVFLHYLWLAVKFFWEIIANLASTLVAIVVQFFRKRPKKYLFMAIGLVLLILAVNVGVAAYRKSSQEKRSQQNSALTEIESKLSAAEAALIYEDENKTVNLMSEVEKELSEVKGQNDNPQYKSLQDRLVVLRNKVNKEIKIDNPKVLTQFPNIPTDLLPSPNGVLGFNRNSQTLSFYDFRTGETKAILKTQNTGSLILGEFAGDPFGYLFLDRDGKFAKLNLPEETLVVDQAATSILDMGQTKIQRLKAFGEGALLRFYLLDIKQNQIWRVRNSAKGFGIAEAWLAEKEKPDFREARDLSVDGSIYVQFPDRVEKYFNGQKQPLNLAAVNPPLRNAAKIFTQQAYQFLYIADPEHGRILIFTKAGKLKNQITSPKFRDLSDIYVNEPNKLLYALSGAELVQINF